MTLLLHFLFDGVFDAPQQLRRHCSSETAQSVDPICLLLGCQAVHYYREGAIEDGKVVVLPGLHAAAVQHFIVDRELHQLQRQLCVLAQHGEKPVKGFVVSHPAIHGAP